MHVGIANPRWREKRSWHSPHMRNPQFYVSGKRPMPLTCCIVTWCRSSTQDILGRLSLYPCPVCSWWPHVSTYRGDKKEREGGMDGWNMETSWESNRWLINWFIYLLLTSFPTQNGHVHVRQPPPSWQINGRKYCGSVYVLEATIT